jgi:hypothetical protein
MLNQILKNWVNNLENNFEQSKLLREIEYEIPDLFEGELNDSELSYYELTEAVHQYYMKK